MTLQARVLRFLKRADLVHPALKLSECRLPSFLQDESVPDRACQRPSEYAHLSLRVGISLAALRRLMLLARATHDQARRQLALTGRLPQPRKGWSGARTLLRHHLRKQYPRSGARYAGPQNPQLASTQPLLPAGEALSVASSTVRVKEYQRVEGA